MPSSFTAAFRASRLITRHEVFGNLIEELTPIVERQFPGSSPLVENSARTWTFIASRFIYSHTSDVISGSLALAVLISFLISRHEMPMYVCLLGIICRLIFDGSNPEN